MATGPKGRSAGGVQRRPVSAPSRKRPPAWRKKFLTALAETSNVTASCERAKITPQHVYALRQDDPEFHRAWQVALCEGYDMLEMSLLGRLRGGEEDEGGASKRKFDNATAFRLLAAHRETAVRQRALRDHDDAAAVRASIDAKLDEMRERVLAARAAVQAGDRAADDQA
jgi:hypothetical protein